MSISEIERIRRPLHFTSMSATGRSACKRIVVKIGTSSIIEQSDDGTTKLALINLATIVDVLASLRGLGHDVVLVSSGAVGAGCHQLGITERPDDMNLKKALASIGQVHLMSKYEQLFTSLGYNCAQMLLTYENFVDRKQFVNAKNTFEQLFIYGIIPVVNENDCVGVAELKADNDKLACMVGNMIHADIVFLLTDVSGVFTANPNDDPSARLIPVVRNIHELKAACNLEGEDSAWGTGGISAKVEAANLASTLGVRAVIMSADESSRIPSYLDTFDEEEYSFGTTFMPSENPPGERKRWIKSLLRRGTIQVTFECIENLTEKKNVKTQDILSCKGDFSSMESVRVMDPGGAVIGCGLSNFASEQIDIIKGLKYNDISEDIQDMLGESRFVMRFENFAFYKDVEENVPPTPPTNDCISTAYSSTSLSSEVLSA